MSISWSINKVWSIRTVEYYLVIKRSEILTHAITRMNFKALY